MFTLKQIFLSYRYLLLMGGVMVFVLLLSLFLLQYESWMFILTSDIYSFVDKIKIIGTSLGSFQSMLTRPSQFLILSIALLSGVNISLGIFYMKRRIRVQKLVGANFVSILSGIVGIGCASCGSILLTSLFGTGVATGLLKWLPFQGLEFGLIGLSILVLSIVFTLKKIETPTVCPIRLED